MQKSDLRELVARGIVHRTFSKTSHWAWQTQEREDAYIQADKMLRGYRAVSLPKSLKEFAINVCVPLLLFPLCAVLGGLAVFAVFALINVDAALEFFDWVF